MATKIKSPNNKIKNLASTRSATTKSAPTRLATTRSTTTRSAPTRLATTRSTTTDSAPAKKSVTSLQPRRRRIVFSFSAPEAQNVSLVGNFNNWDYTKTMKKDKEGLWTSRVDLEPGKYEYRFLVDGEWQDDPKCQTRQANTFGTQNCILEISN